MAECVDGCFFGVLEYAPEDREILPHIHLLQLVIV